MSCIDEKKNILIIDEDDLFYVIKPTDIIGYNFDYKSKYVYDRKVDFRYMFNLTTIYGLIQFTIYSYYEDKDKIKMVEDIKKWLKDAALERSSSFL